MIEKGPCWVFAFGTKRLHVPTQLTQFLLFLQKLGVRCASKHVCAPKTFEALCKAMASIEESMDTQSCMTHHHSLRLKSGTFYAVTSEMTCDIM